MTALYVNKMVDHLANMPAHKWSSRWKWSIWPTSHTLVVRSVDDTFPTMST